MFAVNGALLFHVPPPGELVKVVLAPEQIVNVVPIGPGNGLMVIVVVEMQPEPKV